MKKLFIVIALMLVSSVLYAGESYRVSKDLWGDDQIQNQDGEVVASSHENWWGEREWNFE